MKLEKISASAAADALSYGTVATSLGLAMAASSERGLAAVLLGDDEAALLADLQARFPAAQFAPGGEAMSAELAAVAALIESPAQPFALPLDIGGTAFQQRVWQALREIPAGTTINYAELARRSGAPNAVRAAASACAANRIAVVIPCHRVVRSDGSLSGYRWGQERKRALLQREGALSGA